MLLSEHEKEIINKIYKYRTYNFQTYVTHFFDGHDMSAHLSEVLDRPRERFRSIVLQDTTDIYKKSATFLILMQKLANHQLIYMFSYESKEYWEYFLQVDDNGTEESYDRIDILDRLINKQDFSQYIPSSEFFNFVDNGYRTIDEIEKENEITFRKEQIVKEDIVRNEEKKDRVQAQRLTIIISVLSILLSGLFNFLTYKTKREVEIINTTQNPIRLVVTDTSKNIRTKPEIKEVLNKANNQVSKK